MCATVSGDDEEAASAGGLRKFRTVYLNYNYSRIERKELAASGQRGQNVNDNAGAVLVGTIFVGQVLKPDTPHSNMSHTLPWRNRKVRRNRIIIIII